MPSKNKKIVKKIKRVFKCMRNSFMFLVALVLLGSGVFFLWIATLDLPDLKDFEERKISSSTKIYDRTGEVVLFDIHENVERILVDYDDISDYIKEAIVSIEDQKFYTHPGIDLQATIRAVYYTAMRKLGFSDSYSIQGGSTITQQVLKNTLLTSERTVTRKLKEWFLALKLEKAMSKDEILNQYLNEIPFGGSMYGVEQAAQSFFGKTSAEVTIAEAAYLASIPNAPTYYSPYGNNKDRLDNRQQKVLRMMREAGYITEEEYEEAIAEEVIFRSKEELNSKALHFVTYVREQVENLFGRDAIENDGLRIITTLDYDLQREAERIVYERAHENEEKWGASNQALVAVEPETGEILTMVGSRDYGDDEVDGKFNVTLAKRQPGSSFKPFVYATAFKKGYTDKSVLFDVHTQFHEDCEANNLTSQGDCYAPRNYDGEFLGPLSIRNALAQSRNIPAVKMLYLVGLRDALETAKDLGISTLESANRYGLTLVLGGGEVTLLDMTSAYGVFANEGIKNNVTGILKVTDSKGEVIWEHESKPKKVLTADVARRISSVLSDNAARTPLFGSRSFLYFGNLDVAGKTGTTNNNKDAWLIGYSDSIAVGVWSGNNDNTPMQKGSSISGPAWRDFMDIALAKYPAGSIREPEDITTGKPFLDGIWLGGEHFDIDTISGKLATELTPPETRKQVVIPDIHSELHWIRRNDPTGFPPEDPTSQSLYNNFEYAVQDWVDNNGFEFLNDIAVEKPDDYDDVHIEKNIPEIRIITPRDGGEYNINEPINFELDIKSEYPIMKVEYHLNGQFFTETERKPYSVEVEFSEIDNLQDDNRLTVIVIDEVYNRAEATVEFEVID